MELRHLRYFEAVATDLSFRQAAERLHVAQPALSRQIKDLEYELRVRLLDRNTTRVRLTEAGRVFLEEARGILAHAERATEMAREAAAGRRGRLVVGNVGPITASFMPACLTEFRARYPEAAVTLMEIEPAEQIARVDAGTIQVGFTVEKPPVLPRLLSHRRILRSAMCAVVGSGHRLAGAPRVSLEELGREKLLCYAGQRVQTHADLVRGIFAAHRIKCRPITVVAGFESLLAMIAGGQGVSLMPEHIIVSATDRIAIVPLQETGEDLVFEVTAVWRDDDSSPLAQKFVQLLGRFNRGGAGFRSVGSRTADRRRTRTRNRTPS
jgi:DNA-binding transcriptional LysR family regulator